MNPTGSINNVIGCPSEVTNSDFLCVFFSSVLPAMSGENKQMITRALVMWTKLTMLYTKRGGKLVAQLRQLTGAID